MFAISILTSLCTLSFALARFSVVPPVEENFNGNSELGLFRMESDGQGIEDAENKEGGLELPRVETESKGIGKVKHKGQMDDFVTLKLGIIRALSKHIQALTGNPLGSVNSEDTDDKKKQMISSAWQKISKWMDTKKGSFEDITFHKNSLGNNYARTLPISSFRLRKRDHLREYSKKFDHRCFGCLHSQRQRVLRKILHMIRF